MAMKHFLITIEIDINMKQKIITLLILLAILFLGNKLREVNYATVPAPGENADEYAYSWIGLSILEGRAPKAWSSFPSAYKKVSIEKINVDNIFLDKTRPPFTLTEPWYDSPPLMGIIVSSFAYLNGVRDFNQASVIITRRPVLKIALITTVLIFILGTIIWGKWVGLLSSLLYSISPVMVISSRMVVPENGYTPLFLGLMICIFQYFKTKKISYWIAACILGIVAFFFKFSGIVLLITLGLTALMFGQKDRVKLVKYTLIAIVITIAIFLLYGKLYDWNVFVNVMLAQMGRFYGASSEAFFQAFNTSKVFKPLTDGWLNLGWVSLFIVSFIYWKEKEIGPKLIIVSFFSYLIVFLLLGSEAYGHYRIPFYPLLAISSAKLLIDLIKAKNVALFLPLMLLPFGTALHRLVGVEGFQTFVPYFRYFLILSLGVFSLGLVKSKWAARVQILYMILVISFVVFISMKEIYFYNIDKWYFVT